MKSLRDLRNELLGVRMYATSTSLWYLGGTLTEASRVAINDALKTYEFSVRKTHHSINLPDTGRMVAVLPNDVHRVVEVHALSTTTSDVRRELKGWAFRATVETKMLYLDARAYPGARNVEVAYESRLLEAPPEVAVGESMAIGATSVLVSGGIPKAEWRAPGYFAIYSQVNTTQREIVKYAAVTPTHFTGLSRNIGAKSMATNWSLGDIISPVLEIPEQALPVLQHAAQAEMYHFWVKNRALYDQFTAVASLQQLDLGDLLGLIRTEEDRADRRYKRIKTPPAPTHGTKKRVRR